ncbi:MAG: FAD-dependent oxidoreductase [Clostridia bacterium]|nr:FAD-dependent oxidoreductase [Clostridia bacterium]
MKELFYDVVVAGAGPAGICAAVSAARAGARVALLERFGMIGGMLTSGAVQPILGSAASGTIYDEIAELALKSSSNKNVPVSRIGKEIPLDLENFKILLSQFVHDSGVELYLCSPVVDTVVQDRRLCGVIAALPEGLTCFMADAFIDSTGDGTLSVLAGAGYSIGRDGDNATQPASIEFTVDHVDESTAITCYGGSDPVCLPDGRSYSAFCREAEEKGVLPRNVTIVRLHKTGTDGERNVNANQVNGIDLLTGRGLAEAEYLLRGQIRDILSFLREYVPGYENCLLKSSGSTVGVRETRRITGLKEVSDHDVEVGTHCGDVVVHNAWFLIDIHNPTGGGQEEGYSHMAQPYDIPYGAIVPKGVDGLLTSGRCISGTHRANASYRVSAICMMTGQAAGAAAALCSRQKILPRFLDITDLQKELTAQGCNLAG